MKGVKYGNECNVFNGKERGKIEGRKWSE